MIYNGKIILLIEAIDKFREKDGFSESRLKFWFPKSFPTRFRVIVTASRDSHAYQYFKKRGSQILKLETTADIYQSLLRSYSKRKFVVDPAYKAKIFDLLQKKVNDQSIEDTLLIKSTIGCLCPYETPQVLSISSQAASRIQQVLLTFDLQM